MNRVMHCHERFRPNLEESPIGVHRHSLDMLGGFGHSSDAAKRGASATEFCTVQAHGHQELHKAQPIFSNIQSDMYERKDLLSQFLHYASETYWKNVSLKSEVDENSIWPTA